jgi:prepilin-type N-terminal cleavage/methylation domain-containing protein
MSARHAGYTLLEVVVVLVILAIAGAVAAPAFATWRPARDVDDATSRLVAALSLARERAVAGGRGVELVVDATNARVWLRPRDTSFALALPDGCRLDGALRSIVHFSADGPALGSMPDLTCGADRVRLTIDPLTGVPAAVEAH